MSLDLCKPVLRSPTAFAALFALGMTTPALLTAQDAQTRDTPAVLIADSMQFDDGRLVASGAVEVFYENTRLTAGRIAFDERTDQLTIEGPIRLTDEKGDITLYASAAELDADLQNGILISARMVIEDQMQLAAASIERIDDRYTRLNRSVASACQICADRPVPLWEIRARDIIHDQETRQLYFNSAQFRVGGIPVFYLPRMRIPDPSVERATGFLAPEISTSSTLGTGVEIPYFITLGPSHDITVAPFVASQTRTLKTRYRGAFTNGEMEVNGALTSDSLDDNLRGYMFAEGEWLIGNDLTFSADLRLTSDISYLHDYGFYGGDRLMSSVSLSRYSANEAFDLELQSLRTLRESEVPIEDTLPFVLGEMRYEKVFENTTLPGTTTLGVSASGHARQSSADIDGTDVLRIGAVGAWENGWIFGNGFKLDTDAALNLDAYTIAQNSNYDTDILRMTPSLEARLSWPLVRTTAGGGRDVLEPIIQTGWSRTYGGAVPNADSALVEFDESNLFSLMRYPGYDRYNMGVATAAGLRFSHYGPAFDYGLTVGRVAFSEESGYSTASGLSGDWSDWLIGARISGDSPLSLSTRALLNGDLAPTKLQTRIDYDTDRFDLAAVHAFVVADDEERRSEQVNGLNLSSSLALTDNWTAFGEYRYDFAATEPTYAGFGLEFLNECVRVRLGASRRYTETEAIEPDDSLSLSVSIGAFGRENARPARQCLRT